MRATVLPGERSVPRGPRPRPGAVHGSSASAPCPSAEWQHETPAKKRACGGRGAARTALFICNTPKKKEPGNAATGSSDTASQAQPPRTYCALMIAAASSGVISS